MIAADRRTHSPNRLVWSGGWRPPGAQSAFIKWTGWTLAMTMSWWQHHKHCPGYYYYAIELMIKNNRLTHTTGIGHHHIWRWWHHHDNTNCSNTNVNEEPIRQRDWQLHAHLHTRWKRFARSLRDNPSNDGQKRNELKTLMYVGYRLYRVRLLSFCIAV